MADIEISVAGTPPKGTYNSASRSVAANGDVTIHPGTTTVRYSRAPNQSWEFIAPWITFEPSGPFSLGATSGSSIQFTDSDRGGPDKEFEYTLYTSQGNFDPKIINKGSGT